MASRSAPTAAEVGQPPPAPITASLEVVADVALGGDRSTALDARDAGDAARPRGQQRRRRPPRRRRSRTTQRSASRAAQLVDRPDATRRPRDEDADAVADLLDLVQQVRRQQHRHALVGAQPLDEQQQLAHAFGVDVHGRLVEDQDRRLLTSASATPSRWRMPRERPDLAVGVVGQADVGEQAVDPLLGDPVAGGGSARRCSAGSGAVRSS